LASTCITDPPPLPLRRLRHADLRANTPSIERNILSVRIAQTGISKDSDVRRGDQGERSGKSTGLTW
jgi:hypothetical protein